MSYKNPTVIEVIENSIDRFNMSKHLHKSYLNLAKNEFYRAHNKQKATIEDSQELFDNFVSTWRHYYKRMPILTKLHRKRAQPIWDFACNINIDVSKSSLEFIRIHNPNFEDIFDYNYASWIMKNKLFNEYKEFVSKNRKRFKYHRKIYTDYSHLAYNGVTDDF